jgi:hypothetical protein
MTDPPDGDDERPVARWLLEQFDDAPPTDEPAADTPEPEVPAAEGTAPGQWLLLSSPPISVPAPELRPLPTAAPAGPGTRLGCALLEVVLFVAGLGLGWIVWWVALWPRGETPARSILHLELVRAGGAAPSPSPLSRTAVREVLAKALLPAAPISALVFLAGRRGLWDRVTGTTVVVA